MAYYAPASLRDATTLPEGQPLQPLPRIANLADRPGLFRSVLTPAPHAVALGDDYQAHLWLYNRKVAPLIEEHLLVVNDLRLCGPATGQPR